MNIPPFTQGNLGFNDLYIRSLLNRFREPATRLGVETEYVEAARDGQRILNTLNRYRDLGLIEPTPEPKLVDPDETYGLSTDGNWEQFFVEEMMGFAAGGSGTAGSIAEALMISNALARALGADSLFYRGEHRYGHRLLSRAERKLTDGERSNGISRREIDELRRFQDDVRGDQGLIVEMFDGALPDLEDPKWLTAMQHYDEGFGTRLIDLTRSIFAGLYFACLSWRGDIDEQSDGLLYIVMDTGSWTPHSHHELRASPTAGKGESLDHAFEGWEAPEYVRLYDPPSANPRSLAQDGVFLVRADIGAEPNYGQQFRMRIPAHRKSRIVRELWIAGYTPERIVRGASGHAAHQKVAGTLGVSP